jgi:hypothetical protein
MIGIVLIVFTAADLYQQRHKLDLDQLWRSLALTIWLPLVALPFVYLFALVAGYELAFMRLEFANQRQKLALRTR